MKNSDDKILGQIKQIILNYLDEKSFKIFLFGSRAQGTYKYNSDYDIGIEGKKPLDFDTYLTIRSQIGELPANIDIVDFQNVSPQFKEIAKRNVIYL